MKIVLCRSSGKVTKTPHTDEGEKENMKYGEELIRELEAEIERYENQIISETNKKIKKIKRK